MKSKIINYSEANKFKKMVSATKSEERCWLAIKGIFTVHGLKAVQIRVFRIMLGTAHKNVE